MDNLQRRLYDKKSFYNYVKTCFPKEKDLIEEYVEYLGEEAELDPDECNRMEAFMKAVFDRKVALVSVDLEFSMKKSTRVTEVGVSVYDPWSQKGSLLPFVQSSHIIVRENQPFKDNTYVPDHTDFFNGGKSVVMSLHHAAHALNLIIEQNTMDGNPRGSGVALVGHGMDHDLLLLRDMGVDFGVASIMDTQDVLAYTHGARNASLKNALRLARIPFAFLHNAGNDAYYTLLLSLALADPVYRLSSGLDSEDSKDRFASQKSTRNEPPNTSSKVHLKNATKFLGFHKNPPL